MMATSRDSLFMRRITLLTKQVPFYACKIEIKPKPYPLSLDIRELSFFTSWGVVESKT